MFHSILKTSRPSISRHTFIRLNKQTNYINTVRLSRPFHANHRLQVPILPLPAFVLALKTGQLVTCVTALSRLSLTLAAGMSKRKGKIARAVVRLAASVPLLGVASLLVIGLDEAPNTSRIRLSYLDKEEQQEMIDTTLALLLSTYSGSVAPQDSSEVQWLQTIVNRLAAVAVDDVRDPVRRYFEDKTAKEKESTCLVVPSNDVETIARSTELVKTPDSPLKYKVHYITDGQTVNALCVGSDFVVFDQMANLTDFDENKMAAILAHEMAHSLQSHFVEKHGLMAFVSTVGDISRAVLWPITFSLGPYFNDGIDRVMSWLTEENCEKSYNRQLEREADLVGLKLMAKAGYDPECAVDVWKSIYEAEEDLKKFEEGERKVAIEEEEWVMSLDDWFGGTHPPTPERIEYLTSHLSKAMRIYKKSVELNGRPSLTGTEKKMKQKTDSDTTEGKIVVEVIERTTLEPKTNSITENQPHTRIDPLKNSVLVN